MRILILVLLCSSASMARNAYPPTIKSKWTLAVEPDCTLCHSGTRDCQGADTLFARSIIMANAGFCPGTTTELQNACATLRQNNNDSDMDGFSDYAELSANSPTDPNDRNSKPAVDAGTDGGAKVDAGTDGGNTRLDGGNPIKFGAAIGGGPTPGGCNATGLSGFVGTVVLIFTSRRRKNG